MRIFRQKFPQSAPIVILVIILLFGAYLRLYRIPEYMTFLGDEGRDMLVIKRMIVDHKFTLLGPTASVGGFFLGPIYYYFMLPFVWISGMNPAGAAAMVAIFGILTIYLLYRTGKDMFDEWVGLIAAALYAVSPVVIAYSRSSWNPNLVPFFSTFLIYLLWKITLPGKQKLLFWAGIMLGIGLQLHYLFLFLFPVTFLWLLLYGRKIPIKFYLLGVMGFIVGYGPFLAFELRHGFPNTIAISNFLRQGDGTGLMWPTFWKNIMEVPYRLFGRLVFRLPPPEQFVSLSEILKQSWLWGTRIAIFSSLIFLVAKMIRAIKAAGKTPKKINEAIWNVREYVLVFLWFIMPLVLFGFYKKGIYDYYFGIFFTLPFLLTALVLRSVGKIRVGMLVSAIVVIFLIFLNWEGRPFKYIPNNQLAQTRMIAKEAFDKTEGKPYNFALLANFNSDHAYRYFFEIWGDPPVTIENEQKDPGRQSVTDQLIIICELPECKPLGHPLWEIAGFGRAEIAGEWPVSFVKIMKLVHYKGEAPLQ